MFHLHISNKKMRCHHIPTSNLVAGWLMIAAMVGGSFSAALGREPGFGSRVANLAKDSVFNRDTTTLPLQNTTSRSSLGDFPICTETNGPLAPFCLPQDGEEVMVDATYYVTWNADFYPLNATITIELRYSSSSNGDSTFTSERTDNSYGYVPLHMRKEWLQGKPHNALTLYIIELDPKSDRRASARQGPTIILRPKPIEHYKPPPPVALNKLALYIGLPVCLGVVIGVVAGLFFGMQERRRIGLGNIMGSRGKGYGIGKSKNQRLGIRKEVDSSDALSAMKKYSEDLDEGMTDPDTINEPRRTASYAFRREVSKLKSWSG